MKIGILQTGHAPENLIDSAGNYDEMFRTLLADGGFEFETFAVVDNQFPSGPEAADGRLITGSKHGAYEDHDWIPPLEDFLRRAVAARIPVAGFCFGHQILAQALGGTVVKSDKGWGLGIHNYDLLARPDWMADAGTSFAATAIHQDQVTDLPEGAHVLASSEFCPHAVLAYGDIDRPIAISTQPHPEFEPDFTAGLIDARIGAPFPVDRSLAAQKTLGAPNNNRDWSRWVVAFFRAALNTR